MNIFSDKFNSIIKNKWSYILFAIFLIILFFLPRFYEYNKRFGFDWDQENIAFEAKKLLKDHKLTLLGPRANNDRGFFLGPQFTYLIAPFFLLSNLHPKALIYFFMTYDLIFFLITFAVLKKIYNIAFACFFLLMWGVNYLLIEADTSVFWPIILPLGVILTIFSLYLIYHKKEIKWWLALGLIIGFFANIHFQFVFMGLFVFIFILISFKHIKPSIVKILVLLLGLLIMFSPLILFDMRHNFFNTKLFVSFFTQKDPNASPYFYNWFPVFQNVIYPFVFSKIQAITYLFYFGVLSFLVYLSYRKQGFEKKLYISTLILWISFPLFFSIYGKRPSEYYFNFLYPLIIICLIAFVLNTRQYFLGFLFLFMYLWMNIYAFLPRITTFGLSFDQKEQVVLRIKQFTNDQPCDIAFNVPLGRQVGYSYLFDYYHVKQIGNWKSCVVNINIPPKPNDEVFGYTGLTLPTPTPTLSKNKIVN